MRAEIACGNLREGGPAGAGASARFYVLRPYATSGDGKLGPSRPSELARLGAGSPAAGRLPVDALCIVVGSCPGIFIFVLSGAKILQNGTHVEDMQREPLQLRKGAGFAVYICASKVLNCFRWKKLFETTGPTPLLRVSAKSRFPPRGRPPPARARGHRVRARLRPASGPSRARTREGWPGPGGLVAGPEGLAGGVSLAGCLEQTKAGARLSISRIIFGRERKLRRNIFIF